MYDQHSTDGSVELAESLGIEVRPFGNNTINDQVYLDIKNHCWKECKGKGIDYVIVCDVDEFLFIREAQLMNPKSWNPMPKVNGFNMISESLPVNDMFEINTGSESVEYSKQVIFKPDFVSEINFVHGCHKNNAVTHGVWLLRECGVELYHYRMIGGVQRLIDRHAQYRERLSEFNKKHKMGFHYEHSDSAKRDEWNFLKSRAKELW